MTSERDYSKELAAHYERARSRLPDAGRAEITRTIMGDLDEDALTALAAEMLAGWPDDQTPSGPPADRRTMTEVVVFKFVCTMEPGEPTGR